MMMWTLIGLEKVLEYKYIILH